MWKPNIDSKKTQNRLSVSEKYQALKAFEKFGNFTMVCRFFNCGVDQIRSIVVNKQKVTAQHYRAQKILILGKVVYEWFLRARRSLNMNITNNMIKDAARVARKEMNIDNTFVPNNTWLAEFRQINNITDYDMKHRKKEAGPRKLDIKTIVAEIFERESNNINNSDSELDDIINFHDDSEDNNTILVSNPKSLNSSQDGDDTSTSVMIASPTKSESLNTSKKEDSMEANQTVTRIQNRLSLFEKLQALKAYEEIGNYTKVARSFNCSTDQIKSIVINKHKFLHTYGSLPLEVRENYEETQSIRAERIVLINKIVYEWFLRARRNGSEELSSKHFSFFQRIALDVRKVLRVDNFFPNNAWLAQFLQKYNITNLEMKPAADDPGPLELDITSIVKDVVESEDSNANNMNLTKPIVDNMELQSINERSKAQDLIRAKKVSLVGKVMFEWFLRARRNPSICPISCGLLKKTALDVKYILKIDDFSANSAWLSQFRLKYNITDLDMRLQVNESGSTDLDIEAILAEVLKRTDGPSCDMEDFDYHFAASSSPPLPASSTKRQLRDRKSNVYYHVDDEDDDDELPSKYMKFEVDAINIENDEDSSSKYIKLEDDVIQIDSDEDDNDDDSGRTKTSHNRCVVINNLEEALEHLKPLEDFALMKENYRVIGLISQLEIAFQNSKGK